MPKKHGFEGLRPYLPDHSYELVMPLILQYKVHLTVTRERSTKLGDYRNAWGNKNHRISVNGNLNTYAFLITLLHELAHLLAFEQYGHRIQPHGNEWKKVFGQLLAKFLEHHIFPNDIARQLSASLHNQAASTCADDALQRVLINYDKRMPGLVFVEEIREGSRFLIKGGRLFVRGEKLRKRIKCFELPGMKPYLFSPIYEVMQWKEEKPD